MTTIPDAAIEALAYAVHRVVGHVPAGWHDMVRLLEHPDIIEHAAAALPHLTSAPQAEGDVREALAEGFMEHDLRWRNGDQDAYCYGCDVTYGRLSAWDGLVAHSKHLADLALSSGLVVPVGEVAEVGAYGRAMATIGEMHQRMIRESQLLAKRTRELSHAEAERDAALATVERGRDAVLVMDRESIDAGLLEPDRTSLEASRILRALGGVDHG